MKPIVCETENLTETKGDVQASLLTSGQVKAYTFFMKYLSHTSYANRVPQAVPKPRALGRLGFMVFSCSLGYGIA